VLRVEDFFQIGASTDGDVWRLELAGELDLASAEVLMWEVRHLPTSEHQTMVVDLRFLEFADVVGIRALLDAYALLSEHCHEVTLTHPTLDSDGAFRLVRASRLVPFAN
jgi:anti-anti-sigma factor